jgi:STE24 endopeptidase
MAEGTLKTEISKLADQAGIGGAPIFVVDKSRQSQKLNAYVTGIGNSARIVLWDNTVNKLPQDQVLSIVAHEIGHYVLMHIYIGFAIASAVLLAGLLPAQRYAEKLVAKLPSSWRISGLTDPAVIPAAMMLLTVINFISDPIVNSISRHEEHQADEFGLKLTGNGPAMARTFVSLSEQNLSLPDPPFWIEFWLFSHPTLKNRIDYALNAKSPGSS